MSKPIPIVLDDKPDDNFPIPEFPIEVKKAKYQSLYSNIDFKIVEDEKGNKKILQSLRVKTKKDREREKKFIKWCKEGTEYDLSKMDPTKWTIELFERFLDKCHTKSPDIECFKPKKTDNQKTMTPYSRFRHNTEEEVEEDKDKEKQYDFSYCCSYVDKNDPDILALITSL